MGIGTVTPNGILDIESTTQGVVLPKLILTDEYIAAPAINPNTGVNDIPVGTVVYNTNASNHGAVPGVSEDVSPGIYVWNGTKWMPQFTKKQYNLYAQTVQDIRTQSNEGIRAINGVDGQVFTAQYTGIYRIEVNVTFGGGQVKIPKKNGNPSSQSDGEFNVARMKGQFYFVFNGSTYVIKASSFSTAYLGSNGNNNSTTNYFGIWKQFSYVTYIPLVAGDVRTINLGFDQETAFEFLGEGNNNDADTSAFFGGDGHVGFDIPCTVEIIYIGE